MGGRTGNGGSSTIAGGTAFGGTAATGGATTTPTGGAGAATGGSKAAGGAATGGSVATGGAATGGSVATGGAATGGSIATGGAATGGSVATGGAATGGSVATGGAPVNTGGVAAGGSGQGGQSALLASCNLLLHMDETSWNGTAGEVRDSSGAGNHGTAQGGAVTASSRAKFGRAALFNGASYLVIPNATTLHAGTAFTISAWIYSTGFDGSQSPGIVTKRRGFGDGAEFTLFAWIDNHVYVDIDTENDRFLSNQALTNDAWYNIAVVFDGSLSQAQRVSLYINGQLDSIHAESSATVMPTDAAVEIGNLPNGGNAFTGSIDEVAFWQRALTSVEVASLYQRSTAL